MVLNQEFRAAIFVIYQAPFYLLKEDILNCQIEENSLCKCKFIRINFSYNFYNLLLVFGIIYNAQQLFVHLQM